MKKFLVASSVAAIAMTAVAFAQSYSFNTNLTIGSTGSDVVALQTALIAAGYDIPAISSGAAAKGYFGSQTQTAVKAYQSAHSIPNTGFVGPLTRAALNSGSSMSSSSSSTTTAVNCPAGYTCTANTPAPVVNCPAGYTCTANTGTGTVTGTAGTGLTAGTDGSLTVSTSAFVSSGQSLKKGDTKDVVAVRLQATAGPVSIQRFDVHFSVRPWLFFNQVTLKDSTGKVIATKPINSSADATEVTVGSDYLVRFDGLNYVVTPGSDVDLAVGVSVLPATDKIPSGGQAVTALIDSNSIRDVNGIGVTETVGGVTSANPLPTTGAGASTFTLTSTGSVADISTKIAASAPASQVSQVVNANNTTNDVPLGFFSLKAQNNSATVNNMNFQINTNPAFTETGLFSNVRIVVGGQTYGASSFNAAGLAKFTNLTINLPQDQWVDVKLMADVAATSSDVLASSTMVADSIDAVDSDYNQATVGTKTYTQATNDQTSVNTLLTINSMSISGMSASNVQDIVSASNGPTIAESVAYTFTLTNNSNNNLYVSSNVSTFINGTSTDPASNASSTITAFNPLPAVAGDVSGSAYIIPTGSSRTFTVTGLIQKSSASVKQERLSITSIQYGTSSSAPTGSNITSGLETLSTAVVI
ncbi:MAG: peptidoglycan-binding protein [Patescibacteria group bacterium]|nr:peptidoglycan-binding protein [Patescibacteria group bacterium]